MGCEGDAVWEGFLGPWGLTETGPGSMQELDLDALHTVASVQLGLHVGPSVIGAAAGKMGLECIRKQTG